MSNGIIVDLQFEREIEGFSEPEKFIARQLFIYNKRCESCLLRLDHLEVIAKNLTDMHSEHPHKTSNNGFLATIGALAMALTTAIVALGKVLGWW